MDDLGKRITQVPGFSWELGMAVAGEDGTFVVNRAPYGYHGGKCEDDAELQLETDEWVYAKRAALDLDHPSNTGFLLALLWAIPEDRLSGPPDDLCPGDVSEMNHALARAIIAASEANEADPGHA